VTCPRSPAMRQLYPMMGGEQIDRGAHRRPLRWRRCSSSPARSAPTAWTSRSPPTTRPRSSCATSTPCLGNDSRKGLPRPGPAPPSTPWSTAACSSLKKMGDVRPDGRAAAAHVRALRRRRRSLIDEVGPAGLRGGPRRRLPAGRVTQNSANNKIDLYLHRHRLRRQGGPRDRAGRCGRDDHVAQRRRCRACRRR
jgi:hypothetical protein